MRCSASTVADSSPSISMSNPCTFGHVTTSSPPGRRTRRAALDERARREQVLDDLEARDDVDAVASAARSTGASITSRPFSRQVCGQVRLRLERDHALERAQPPHLLAERPEARADVDQRPRRAVPARELGDALGARAEDPLAARVLGGGEDDRVPVLVVRRAAVVLVEQAPGPGAGSCRRCPAAGAATVVEAVLAPARRGRRSRRRPGRRPRRTRSRRSSSHATSAA